MAAHQNGRRERGERMGRGTGVGRGEWGPRQPIFYIHEMQEARISAALVRFNSSMLCWCDRGQIFNLVAFTQKAIESLEQSIRVQGMFPDSKNISRPLPKIH